MIGLLSFGFVAACALLSAVAVVRSAHLIRAVVWLGVTLFATAVLYAMLDASFLAAIQVLLYVGGVVTLMIFGVMITRRHDGIVVPAETDGSGRGGAVALAMFAVLAWAILATPGIDDPGARAAPTAPAELGRALLRDHLLAFEAVSMLLLGAIVGAIVIARKRDPAAARAPAVVAAGPSPEVAP